MRDLLLQLASQGTGIIVSSHSLEELNKLIDTITIIKQGKVIFQGKKSDYLSLGQTKNNWLLVTDHITKTEIVLNDLQLTFKLDHDQFEICVPAENAEELRRRLLNTLLDRHIAILKIAEQEDNFEDIFLSLSNTGEADHEKIGPNGIA